MCITDTWNHAPHVYLVIFSFCSSSRTAQNWQLENAWQSLAYSPLGAVVSPPSEYQWNTLTYWLPPCLAPSSYWTYQKSPQKKNSPPTVQLLMFQTPGSQNRISPNFYKMYRNNWWLLCWNQNCDPPIRFQAPTGRIRIVVKLRQIQAKIVRFNSENSEIVRWKFTKFGQDVAWLLPWNLLKADLRSANPLSNAEAKSKGHSPRRRLYNFLCLKLRGHWTESHKISTGCTEMIADCSAEIKIAIFESVWKRQRDEWRSSSNCGRIAVKIVRFNSVNSEITWRKFTKFGHDVPWLLPLNLLKADLQLANPLSDAEAKSNGHSTRRLRTSPIFKWLT